MLILIMVTIVIVTYYVEVDIVEIAIVTYHVEIDIIERAIVTCYLFLAICQNSNSNLLLLSFVPGPIDLFLA